MTRKHEKEHALERHRARNDPLRETKPGIAAGFPSNKRVCADCRTIQPRKGGREIGVIWVCATCLKEAGI
jgi:hypothetical protein